MSEEYYVGQQYKCDKLSYTAKTDTHGYWVFLRGNILEIVTSVNKTPVWHETYNRDEKRDEVDALIAWRVLCRGLKESQQSLRALLDMHCRLPFGKPAIVDSQWPEKVQKHDQKRLSLKGR